MLIELHSAKELLEDIAPVVTLLLQWQLAPHWTLSASVRYDRNLDDGMPRWRADSYLAYRF